MKKFEYLYKMFIDSNYDKMKSNEIQKEFTRLGTKGWELIDYNFEDGASVFKREKIEKQLLTE